MPPPFQALQGYDLPTAVQRILEEVDGKPPAPAHFADEGTMPGTLTVQPDNRGPAAVVVNLALLQGGGPPQTVTFRAEIEVKGVTLVEGELAADALGTINSSPVPSALQAPIRLDSKTPMNIQISMLTGETAFASDFRVEIEVLYGSVKACDEVIRRLGQARWWGFYGPRGADTFSNTLTVEIGGRPTYAKQDAAVGIPSTVISSTAYR